MGVHSCVTSVYISDTGLYKIRSFYWTKQMKIQFHCNCSPHLITTTSVSAVYMCVIGVYVFVIGVCVCVCVSLLMCVATSFIHKLQEKISLNTKKKKTHRQITLGQAGLIQRPVDMLA